MESHRSDPHEKRSPVRPRGEHFSTLVCSSVELELPPHTREGVHLCRIDAAQACWCGALHRLSERTDLRIMVGEPLPPSETALLEIFVLREPPSSRVPGTVLVAPPDVALASWAGAAVRHLTEPMYVPGLIGYDLTCLRALCHPAQLLTLVERRGRGTLDVAGQPLVELLTQTGQGVVQLGMRGGPELTLCQVAALAAQVESELGTPGLQFYALLTEPEGECSLSLLVERADPSR